MTHRVVDVLLNSITNQPTKVLSYLLMVIVTKPLLPNILCSSIYTLPAMLKYADNIP